MVHDFEESTIRWMTDRPPAVRQTFCTPDKYRPTHVPLLHLLEAFDMAGISEDLHDGFVMLGPGWATRADERYSSPRTLTQLREDNWRYVRQRTSSARPREHSPALLAELVEETKLGRVIGACSPPAVWTTSTSALHYIRGMDKLQHHPHGDVVVHLLSHPPLRREWCLKLRRGEDWRRSAQNSTVRANDVRGPSNIGIVPLHVLQPRLLQRVDAQQGLRDS